MVYGVYAFRDEDDDDEVEGGEGGEGGGGVDGVELVDRVAMTVVVTGVASTEPERDGGRDGDGVKDGKAVGDDRVDEVLRERERRGGVTVCEA